MLESVAFKLVASNEVVGVDRIISVGATDNVSIPNLDGVCEREAVRDEHLDGGLELRD